MKLEKQKKYTTGFGCQFYGKVKIGRNSVLGNYVVVGYPKENRILQFQQDIDIASEKYPQLLHKVKPTVIGTNCKIDSHVVIHEGTLLENNIIIDDFCRIGYDCVIGEETRIVYGAFVCDRVKIDSNSAVAGFICDGVVIEDHCTVMGQLVHKYNNPQLQWGGLRKSRHLLNTM